MPEFDKLIIPVSCDKCGKEVKEPIEWFKDNCKFSCPNCFSVINVCEKKLVAALNNYQHAIRTNGF
jgi:hypothetical protein